jgi:hypothetical protein
MFERRRAKKRIAREAELVAETPDGCSVHVTGVVRTLEMVLRSPTTGRSVVAYSVRVSEPSRYEPGGFEQNVPFDCVELVPFVIEHATLGRVVIDSQFADLVLPEHRIEKLHDRSWTDFCDERRLSPLSGGVERPLLAGATATILGTLQRRATRPGGDAGFRDAPAQLCLVGDFDHPLLILDED